MEQLISLLEQLAARLAMTTAHLWGILIYQAHIEIAVTVIYSIFTGIGSMCLWKWWGQFFLKMRAGDNVGVDVSGEEILKGVGLTIGSIVVLIMFILNLERVASLPTLILNPDYWALQQLLDAVKTKSHP